MPNKYSEEFPAAGCRSVFPEGEENSFIWRMGRDDSGDSFRPGGRMKEARETILRGSFPRSKGQTGFIPKGRDDRGGIQPCGGGGRFVSISMRAERHRLTGAERTDFVLSALFLSKDAGKTEKSFVFDLTSWGSVIY